MEALAGAGVGLQPLRRPGQAGLLHVRVWSRVRKAEEVRGHAQGWRRFQLRKSRGRLRHQWLLRVHARAVTKPCTAIYCHQVEWDADQLKWEDFRGKVLGGTDPKTACKGLGLAELNTGNNGVHDFASPFGSLAEYANWLGMPLESDSFGRAMLATGVVLTTIKAWCDDPAVPYQGKAQSLFNLVADLDSWDCLRKSASINARFSVRGRGASLRPGWLVCQRCVWMELCA